MIKAYISNKIESENIPDFKEPQPTTYGKAHYSWKIINNLYVRSLNSCGIVTTVIDRPEIYQTTVALKLLNKNEHDFHVAIKPIEHLRTLPDTRNIFVCGWEFPEISQFEHNNNPFNNYKKVLERSNEIWCWSNFTRDTFLKYGIDQAITLPPAVITFPQEKLVDINEIATLSLNSKRLPLTTDLMRMQERLKNQKFATKFVSVLNPFDKRKQIRLMMQAFEAAAQINPNIVLFVKLIIDNIHTTILNIQEILKIHYDYSSISDKIIFISDTLTNGQMMQLLKQSDFYLCTSSTEGLNLPLIEAMSLGVIPIATNVTAMADYINQDNAIILEYDQQLAESDISAISQYVKTSHFPPILDSIINSIVLASSLDRHQRFSLSESAKNTVIRQYSNEVFCERFKTRSRALHAYK